MFSRLWFLYVVFLTLCSVNLDDDNVLCVGCHMLLLCSFLLLCDLFFVCWYRIFIFGRAIPDFPSNNLESCGLALHYLSGQWLCDILSNPRIWPIISIFKEEYRSSFLRGLLLHVSHRQYSFWHDSPIRRPWAITHCGRDLLMVFLNLYRDLRQQAGVFYLQ